MPRVNETPTGWASASLTGFIGSELVKYRDSLLPVLPIHCLWHSQMGAEEKPQQLRILLSWGNACWQISLILILNHAVRSGHNRLNGWWSHPHSPLFLVVSWMFTCVAAGHKFMKLMCCYQSLLVWPLYTSFFPSSLAAGHLQELFVVSRWLWEDSVRV